MLARGALRRLAAEVPKQVAHDLPKLASLVQAARPGCALPFRTLSYVSQLQTRSYATEPTTTVKQAVKTKAAAGKSVTKTTSAKKPAAKKTAKTTAKKAAPKKTKKKAATKKAARKPKKVLTDEEKEKQAITKLKKLALKEPVPRRKLTAFNVYIQEKASGLSPTEGNVSALASASNAWKDISPAEHEKYNHLAAERNQARVAEYNAWVQSHTPDQIRIANNARNLLRRKLAGKLKGSNAPAHTQRIEDERAVKRPSSAWAVFFGERVSSSDFKSIARKEATDLIAGEWRALNASEKQRFVDQASADQQRYKRESAAAQTTA